MEFHITQSGKFIIIKYTYQITDKSKIANNPGIGFTNKGGGIFMGMVSSIDTSIIWFVDNDENKFLHGKIISPNKIILTSLEMNRPDAYIGEFILARK